jgi:hypothetical protein
MRVLIVFGTTEDHTRGLAEFMAARLPAGCHEVAVRDAARQDGPPDPAGFDAAIVATSLHAGRRYQRKVARFARARHAALDGMPSAFAGQGAPPFAPSRAASSTRLAKLHIVSPFSMRTCPAAPTATAIRCSMLALMARPRASSRRAVSIMARALS